MSIQSDIKTALAGIAGNRVYPEAAPENATLPLVVYRKTGAEPLMTLQGYAGMTRFSFVFECWARTYAEAITLADQVRTAIEAAAALKPQYRDFADPDDYEPAVDQFLESVAYSFWHT
jgi:hypothetical protein